MKIIHRYILKEHVGPFVFALSALTSLLLLQYIARKFGDLVGRGLSWQIITEFLLLSIPFTLAMTLPMAVLVSVLYAFSRLAGENEVTALKAGGISSRSLMWPSVIWASGLAVFMLWFNDQLLPKANHELATLQMAILRTKPTFALRPQVINNVKEGQLYLRAGRIDQGSDHMYEVTIYDVSNSMQRRTIYADSGILSFAENRKDLNMSLYSGMMMSAPTDKVGQLTRIYYKRDVLKVRDVANTFPGTNSDSSLKGDREMSVCEMQKQYEVANVRVAIAHSDSLQAAARTSDTASKQRELPKYTPPPQIGGIGAIYCNFITKYLAKYLHVSEAHAAEPPTRGGPRPWAQQPAQQPVQQPTQQPAQRGAVPAVPPQHPNSVFVMVNNQYIKVAYDKIPPDAYFPGGIPAGENAKREAAASATAKAAAPPVATPPTPNAAPVAVPGILPATGTTPAAAVPSLVPSEIVDAHNKLDDARRVRNRFGIEIQKKFSLAAACIVFVLVGAPVALRFPRGGVGLVIGVSFFVFAVYYVGLIGGESLANKNLVSPFWAMWIDNIIFLTVGVLLMTRMGREGVTNRGGKFGEMLDSIRDRFSKRGARSAG